jgi:hypothetical protein
MRSERNGPGSVNPPAFFRASGFDGTIRTAREYVFAGIGPETLTGFGKPATLTHDMTTKRYPIVSHFRLCIRFIFRLSVKRRPLEAEGQVVLGHCLAFVTEGFRLRAPDAKSRPFVEPLRSKRCGGDAEVNPRYAAQRAGVPDRRVEELGRNALPAMAGRHIQAPHVRLV